jgi:hypothetical protein
MSRLYDLIKLVLTLALCFCGGASGAAAQSLARGFAAPPSDARPLVRWWWFGPAVERNELAREIAAMQAGGFGGFEIQPVYPLALDDPAMGIRNLKFLSDEFLADVRFAADTARAQGMRVDITLGSGWPFGGPVVPMTEASSQIRMATIAVPADAHRAALPPLGPGERLLAVFLARGAAAVTNAEKTKSLAFKSGAAKVSFAPSHRERTLLVFLQSRTGQQVKRPAIGAEGLVLDHMNSVGVRHYLDVVGEKLLSAFGDNPPYSVFGDSLEVFGADWTDDLLAQFRRRRGYDLTPHLPALFFDNAPKNADVRHDWALTLTELVNERYLTTVTAWAQAHHTQFRAQVYGSPPVTLSSNKLVSLAEGEGGRWRQFTPTRWASSANHLYGRSITSAESWTWLHWLPFRATPLDIKVEADRLMLQGVNQFVAHGWPYSPSGAGEPGWSFYAAAVLNAHNPWWPVMSDVNAYLQRLSYLLRQGESVADVAILIPADDAWAGIKPGHASITNQMRMLISDGLTQQILDNGYNFDYVDGLAFAAEGFKHKILILPHVNRIAPALYRRIAAFVKRGGIVIAVGHPPTLGGGLMHAAAQARKVLAISAKLFTANAPHARQVEESVVGATLRALTPADLVGGPPTLGFVHRKLSNGDIYFVANTGNQSVRARLAFREQAQTAQWWEPRSGEAHTWMPGSVVTLAPYESRVFVFGAAASAPVVEAPVSMAQPPAQAIDLSGGWHVLFKGLNLSRTVSVPYSWTQDAATHFYSGEAIYTRTVNLTPAQIAAGQVLLDFGSGTPVEPPAIQVDIPGRPDVTSALIEGPVREAAEVFVGNKRVGSVWAPPYEINLAAFLHAGTNQLEIRVTNTAINGMANQNPPDYRLLNERYGERFRVPRITDPGPLPSGLLHTITLGQQ